MQNLYLSIISKYSKKKIAESDIKMEHKLIDDLGFDSIGFVGMILATEAAYGFSFDDEYINLDKLVTVKDVAQYIAKKIS